MVSFSMKNACKDLQLDDLELFDTLVSLSMKGFIRLVRFPQSEQMSNELRKRFLQMDMLSAVFEDEESKERRDRVITMISTMESTGSELARMTTLKELMMLSHDLDEVIRETAERRQDQSSDSDTQERKETTEQKNLDQLLARTQTKLDRCLEDFWERVELIKQEKETSVPESTPRIVNVENTAERSRKGPGMRRPSEMKKSRTVSLLLAIRADAITKNIAPPELTEELEELEVRALIGEITREAYTTRRKELEQKIVRSKITLVSTEKVGNLVASLQKRIDDTDRLASAEILSEGVRKKIVESAKRDLELVEQNRLPETADFCVSPSGDFLDLSSAMHIRGDEDP